MAQVTELPAIFAVNVAPLVTDFNEFVMVLKWTPYSSFIVKSMIALILPAVGTSGPSICKTVAVLAAR